MIAISLRPTGRKWGTVSFASTLHLCPILDLLVAEIPAQWQAEVRLGLQEALVNAAKHGNKLDPTKTVLVEFYILESEHWWVVSDQGSGFAPSRTCTLDSADLRDVHQVGECGRGLYILHQVFDRVHWNQGGTELRLCKQIRSRPRFLMVD